ncbi:hypothetical protein Tco_0109850 [Tanacetum coccineum]
MSNSSHSSNWYYWKRRHGGWKKEDLCHRVHVLCKCGDVSGMWTSWTQSNPGRRFLGCPNYKFFHWWDTDISKKCYKAEVMELKMYMKEYVEFEKKKKDLEEDIKLLKTKNSFYFCIICVLIGMISMLLLKVISSVQVTNFVQSNTLPFFLLLGLLHLTGLNSGLPASLGSSSPGDGVTTIKRWRHDIHGDGIRDSAMTSGRVRPKVDLEPST